MKSKKEIKLLLKIQKRDRYLSCNIKTSTLDLKEVKRKKESFYGFSYKRKLTSGNPRARLKRVIRQSGEMMHDCGNLMTTKMLD